MELFDAKGCLSEEGLQALVGGQLDETQRMEAAEHLAYCDRCMDRYTALLTDDVLEQPPRSARGAVMGTIWIRLMQNTWGRAAVATVAAVLALEGAPPGMQPEQQVLEALGEEELTEMILDLREPYCTPCRLVLLEQHTMAEAARLCGRPPKTVEAQVYRAKKMLAQQILQNDRIPCERRSVHGTV